jgi:hypothetical protein
MAALSGSPVDEVGGAAACRERCNPASYYQVR